MVRSVVHAVQPVRLSASAVPNGILPEWQNMGIVGMRAAEMAVLGCQNGRTDCHFGRISDNQEPLVTGKRNRESAFGGVESRRRAMVPSSPVQSRPNGLASPILHHFREANLQVCPHWSLRFRQARLRRADRAVHREMAPTKRVRRSYSMSPAVAQGDLTPCFVESHDAAMENWRRGADWADVNEDFFDCLDENC